MIHRVACRSVAVAALALCPTFTVAQQLISPGPFGKPLAVRDDGDNWSVPISVVSDHDVDIVIPNITTPGWAAWNMEQYRSLGTYSVPLNFFYKNDHACIASLTPKQKNNPDYLQACKELRYKIQRVLVDTRKHTVTTGQVIRLAEDARFHPEYATDHPSTVTLSDLDPRLRAAIERVTAIVRERSDSYTGRTIQNANQEDRQIVAAMVAAAHGTPSAPDTSELNKARTVQSRSATQQISSTDDLGTVYQIGNGVTAPELIHQEDPEYPKAAQKSEVKVNGSCVIDLVVDVQGTPQQVRITRSLTPVFDASAIKAVQQYRFRPGTFKGQPVAVALKVEVNFQKF